MIFGRTRARDRSRGHDGNAGLAGVDFTSRAPGYQTAALGGFGYSRASSADSVQTSESTLLICPTQADVLRFGRWDASWDVGLSLGGAQTNYIAWSYDFAQQGSSGKWIDSPSSVSITRTAGQADPAGGTSATRVQISATTFQLGENSALTMPGETHCTASLWLKSGSPNLNLYRATSGRIGSTASASGSWVRASITGSIGAEALAIVPVDGRDWSGIGGLTAGTRDAIIYGASRTGGPILDEYIPTNGATQTRAGTLCWLPSATWQPIVAASGSRLRIELDVRLKGSIASHAALGLVYLWHSFDNASAWFDPGTRVLTIRDTTGATNTCTLPAVAAFERLQLWVEAGGSAATVVKCSINGGATTSLAITGSALGAMATGTQRDLYVCNSNGGAQLWCWLYRCRVWRSGSTPAWAS